MGTTVMRNRIIGTDTVVWSAWEPYDGHSALTWIDGEKVGRIGTRRLPADLDALPAYSDERIRAVRAWHEAQYQDAYAAIIATVPWLTGYKTDMGEIVKHGVPAGQHD